MPLVSKTFSQIITFTRASTATYFDSAGVLQSAAIDVPRFDYNPATLAAQGLLIEESRTNRALQSENFSSLTPWNYKNTSVDVDVINSPSGTLTADKIIEGITTGAHYLGTTSAVFTAGVANTVSVFAKAGERSWLFISGLNDANLGAYFDLTNGVVGTRQSLNTFANITNYGNGWYRCAITFSPTKANPYISFLIASSNNTASYTGDGSSGLYLWGAQFEEGDFPTSYIPTTSTALTRAADVASVNTLSPWYNATEGTLYAETQVINYSSSANPTLFALLGSPVASNQINMFVAGAGPNYRAAIVTAGASQMLQNAVSSANMLDVNKTAIAYATDNSVAQGRISNTTDTSVTIPTVTSMNFGSFAGVSKYIRRITYYPRRLSNAELQAITS